MTTIYNEVAYENAIHRNIINNAQKTFLKSQRNQHAWAWVLDNLNTNSFAISLFDNFGKFGKLTENQVNAVYNTEQRQKEQKKQWLQQQQKNNENKEFVGEIKQRITMTLTLKKSIIIEVAQYHYYDSPFATLCIFEDDKGNTIIWKTKNEKNIQPGDTIKAKATVKEHKEHDTYGKQTIVQRLAILQ